MKNLFLMLLICVCALVLPQNAGAQLRNGGLSDELAAQPCRFDKKEFLDSVSLLECIYEFTEIDTVLNEANDHRLILQVGSRATYIQDYHAYYRDSIYRSRNYDMTLGEAMEISDKYRIGYRTKFTRKGQIYYCQGNVFLDAMEYADSTVHFNWQLHPDTLMVCGYLCRKATATFRGVDWTVWYAEDLPFDAGPWKFNGLPGLVLKAIDGTSTHLYEAIVVRKPHIAFIDKDIHNALIKCTRERFREALYHYVTNANSVVNTSGMFELSESTPQREFYSPQELE